MITHQVVSAGLKRQTLPLWRRSLAPTTLLAVSSGGGSWSFRPLVTKLPRSRLIDQYSPLAPAPAPASALAPAPAPVPQVDKIKIDIEDMKQWQSFIEGWREGLEWEEGRSRLQNEVTALEEVVEQAGLTLTSGLSSLLTCPHCRLTFTRGWGLTNHRLVSFKSISSKLMSAAPAASCCPGRSQTSTS